MSYQVLYRTYRPSKFSEVVGQEYIVKTLKNAIKKKKIAHAYLFAGPRGTGKTTIAKLFAKAINCENLKEEACDGCPSCLAFNNGSHPDIIELDAASNNGVDNIREIIEQVPYAPILSKYKVYIIDEVHMLSASAFNAFLKTLEEPPAHVIFILATTDPQKIIPTVLSRCQRYNFSKLSNFSMKKKMMEILELEEINYEEKALDEIAILAEGGMRDALSILEQALSYNSEQVYLKDIQQIFGLSSTEEKTKLLMAIHQNKISEVITTVRDMYNAGVDVKRLAIDILEIVKEAVIYSDNAEEDLLKKINKIQAIDILNICNQEQLFNDIKCLEMLLANPAANTNFLSYLELCFLKMAGNNYIKEEEKQNPIKVDFKEIKKAEVKTQESNKEIDKVDITKVPEKPSLETTEIKEEKAVETTSAVENKKQEEDDYLRYLASLLLTATREKKINDQIIYNRLELYKLDADKRKFYELLHNTELFASGQDFIVVAGERTKINNLNSEETKVELYQFLNEELGIDKVIFGLAKEDLTKIKDIYLELHSDPNAKPGQVIKPQIKKERTNEEKLRELFDDIRVEE